MKRYRPSATRQADLLTEWQNRCAYCRLPFGLLIWRQGAGKISGRGYYSDNNSAVALRLEWDHFIPMTYSDSNADGVFLPSCHLCNSLKSDKVFRSIEGVREYLEPRWLRRYELACGPVGSWADAAASEMADYVL